MFEHKSLNASAEAFMKAVQHGLIVPSAGSSPDHFRRDFALEDGGDEVAAQRP